MDNRKVINKGAKISGDASLSENASLSGNCEVSGNVKISGNVSLSGNHTLSGDMVIKSQSQLKETIIKDRRKIRFGNIGFGWKSHVFNNDGYVIISGEDSNCRINNRGAIIQGNGNTIYQNVEKVYNPENNKNSNINEVEKGN